MFPKKEFINGGTKKSYTSYLNFAISATTSDRGEKLQFQCIFCGSSNSAVLGATSNIKKHLELHKNTEADLKTWFKAYDLSSCTPHNKYLIDLETMKIVRYFITRNTALSDFDSQAFKDLLSDYKRPIPCSKTFSKVVLDDVVSKVIAQINKIFAKAYSVCLISDIWTTKQMLDFMGVAANVINNNFEKTTIVIGLELMPGSHNAENIKKAIEDIVNKFSFNKFIISGMYSYVNLLFESN